MLREVIYDEDDIKTFLELNQEVNEKLSKNKILTRLLDVQDKISILVGIDKYDLDIIIEKLKFSKYNHKDIIVKEGEVSQEIFFIFSGECHVFVNKKKVGELKAGKTFGETAAIFKKKRNATVACASKDVTVLSFVINHENMEFSAAALATLYKNLAYQINSKLETMNSSSH